MVNKVYILKKLKEVEVYEKEIDRRLERLNELVEMRIQKFKMMNFAPKGIIADFGTGIGVDLLALATIGCNAEFVGVDLTYKGLKTAKNLLRGKGNFHFVRADLLHPPFRDEAFDAINFSHVLHHHPLRFLKNILEEASRVCKNNSSILIAEPCQLNEAQTLTNEINHIRRAINDLESLSSVYDLEKLKDLNYELSAFAYYGNIYPSILHEILEKLGFRIMQSRFIGAKTKSTQAIERMKQKISLLTISDEARQYLSLILEDLEEKCSKISPLPEFLCCIKATKGHITE